MEKEGICFLPRLRFVILQGNEKKNHFFFKRCNICTPENDLTVYEDHKMNITEYNNCVKLHSDALYRFAMQFITDTAAAEDTVQESFVHLWDKHENVEMEQARSFLFTITRNQLVDLLRHEQVRMHYAAETPAPEGHTTAYRQMEMQDVLRKTLGQLPAIQKEVLLLRDWEGFAYKEIAEIAQVSEQQVMTYLFRARVSMRKLLEAEGYTYPSSNKTHRRPKHDEKTRN